MLRKFVPIFTCVCTCAYALIPDAEYYASKVSSVTAEATGEYPQNCPAECSSRVFCQGDLLHDVQLAKIYSDSKAFVDKKLLYSEEEILEKYANLKKEKHGVPSEKDLKAFIDANFEEDPLEQWEPADFKQTPSIVDHIQDRTFKNWVLNLNQIWKELARKVSDDVYMNPKRHSLIYLPNGFIKAGGRFAEMYYWDSYWIIRGLLLCDMTETARGIIENIMWMVKVYGHMPNGSRKYYLQRSQPPMLIQMAATYHKKTSDHCFIKKNLEIMDMEFQWWYKNRMIQVEKDGKVYRLAHYKVSSCTPRPESYREDYALAENATTNEERNDIYNRIKSAAESGWDFSSRHMRGENNSNIGTLINMDTPNLIFVDLNCILHANAVVMSEWYKYFGNDVKSAYYDSVATKLLNSIEKVLWNENVGIWLDYDVKMGRSRNYFYPSNLTPLWTGSYDKKKLKYVEKAIVYLITQKIIKHDFSPVYYGVPTSKENSSQQWDFPNCWAPLQAIVIQGLERTNHPIAQYIAFKMAQNWIKTTYAGFAEDGYMYEKYNAINKGTSGDGGEYYPQTGFGWTNGFCMELFNTWGQYLRSDE